MTYVTTYEKENGLKEAILSNYTINLRVLSNFWQCLSNTLTLEGKTNSRIHNKYGKIYPVPFYLYEYTIQ